MTETTKNKKEEYNFKLGQLIVPNNRVDSAFVYKNKNQLVDGVDYRVATDREYIYYYKFAEQSPNYQEVPSFNQYKNDNSDYENKETLGGADEDFADFEKRKNIFEKIFGGSNGAI